MDYVLVLSFVAMALIGVPVAYALALSVSLVLYAYMDLPQVLIVHKHLSSGIDSFSFMGGAVLHARGRVHVRRRRDQASRRRRPGDGRLVHRRSRPGGRGGGHVLRRDLGFLGRHHGGRSARPWSTRWSARATAANSPPASSPRAGTVGIVIPPSITFVVYGVIANVSIGDLFNGRRAAPGC